MVDGVSSSSVKTECTATALSEFVHCVREMPPLRWIFRGQPLLSDPLLPGSQRPGVRIPGRKLVTFEMQSLADFKRLARPHLPVVPADNQDWEWLAIAQHHGLPTRLLDWTLNAAAALFFAVENPNDNKDSGVWCYHHTGMIRFQDESPFELTNVVVYEPPHIAARLTAQRGCFTAHPDDFPDRNEKWLGDMVEIRVPADSRVTIRRELRTLGIDRAALFPNLDGIAASIRSVQAPPEDERSQE